MRLLRAPAPVDTATIALWLGHETLDSTNKYLHADMELKRRALDRTTPTNTKPGRYRAPTGCSHSSRASDPPNYVARNSPDPHPTTRPPRPTQHSFSRTIGRQRDR